MHILTRILKILKTFAQILLKHEHVFSSKVSELTMLDLTRIYTTNSEDILPFTMHYNNEKKNHSRRPSCANSPLKVILKVVREVSIQSDCELLQCVAERCSVLQCVAVCFSTLQCVAE